MHGGYKRIECTLTFSRIPRSLSGLIRINGKSSRAGWLELLAQTGVIMDMPRVRAPRARGCVTCPDRGRRGHCDVTSSYSIAYVPVGLSCP